MSKQLLAALSAGPNEKALALALTEWRKAPAPGLGELVEVLSEKLPSPGIQWPKKTSALQRAWLDKGLRPEPSARRALLDALTRDAFDGGDSTRFRARLALVARWPPDPRTASALRDLLEKEARRARDGMFSARYLRPLIATLVRQRDSRTRPWLERFISHNPCRASILRQELVALAERALEKCAVVADPPWLSQALPTSSAPKRLSVEQMMGAVFAAPDDRARRLVLADVFMEQDDPRGPFFALNLAASDRRLTSDESRTCEKLQKRLKEQLLGDLAPITKSAVFCDGFAQELVLAATWKSPATVWRDAFSSKWMNTVRHVDGGDAYEATMRELLEVAPPSLRSLTTDSRQLQRVGTTKIAPRLEGLRVTGPASKEARRHLERFENLRWIESFGDLREVTSWMDAAGALELVRVRLEGSAHRQVREGIRATLVAAAEHWCTRTSIPALELNDWKFERVGRSLALSWVGAPIWGDFESWALVELTSAKRLPVKQVTAEFAPAVINLTPSLKAALGKHLPPGTRRA
ncbi:MAG: hypothetical protein Q8S33_35965 [Myxococcales bacterium]|nr:hypothetical protein [Myxococcales bacterium]